MEIFWAKLFLLFYEALPYMAWGMIALYVAIAIFGRKRIAHELRG